MVAKLLKIPIFFLQFSKICPGFLLEKMAKNSNFPGVWEQNGIKNPQESHQSWKILEV
jgi:hypothetical protein